MKVRLRRRLARPYASSNQIFTPTAGFQIFFAWTSPPEGRFPRVDIMRCGFSEVSLRRYMSLMCSGIISGTARRWLELWLIRDLRIYLESRPQEFHPQPLAERCVSLSTHTAPIKQTHLPSPVSSVRRALGISAGPRL